MKLRIAAVLLATIAACQQAPVRWQDPTWTQVTPGKLQLDSTGRPHIGAPHAAPPMLPGAPPRCEDSYRFSWLDERQVYAAWWAARRDGSASLMASFSADGGHTWQSPAPVDSTDVSATGCNRPAPAVAGDGAYVHVAYSLASSEGTGIFFAHSMDRATLFHSPVPIVYGDHLGNAAVAASGDRVVVAYEDLNDPSRIGLAISKTMGHIFEHQTTVTSDVGEPTAPEVALAGRTVAVAWIQHASAGSSTAVRMVRVGRLR